MYDTLLTNGHLLTLAGDGAGFVEDGAVAISGRTILAVGPRAAIEAEDQARRTIDARGGLIMPGLVDAHLHSAATVARGLAQEVATWMGSAYGPLIRHATDDDAPLWTTMAIMEGVANGTTCFGDYETPMLRLAEVHARVGARAVVCQGVSEIDWSNRERWLSDGWRPGLPPPLDQALGERALAAELEVFDRWHGHDAGRIRCLLGPIAADMVSEELLLRAQREARQRGAPIHLHVAQDPRENEATLRRAGLRAIPYLDAIGLIAPDTIAVHLSTATPDEVHLVAAKGGRMTCCSNSIGIIDGVVPPARQFSDAGGTVALGSDQAAGNNSHNIFAEMRATAMFAKIAAQSPLPLPAWRVLRMATIDGARVLGIDRLVGSLEAGKEADVIVIDLNRPPMAPVVLRPARNIVPNLVYAESGANVRLTMVAGKVIYENGRFANLDEDEVMASVRAGVGRFEAAASSDPAVGELPIVELTRSGSI